MKENRLDYLDVSADIQEKINTELSRLNCRPVMILRKSNHPEDDYLYLVWALKEKYISNAGAVWIYNASTGSLNYGAYELTVAGALANMSGRIYDTDEQRRKQEQAAAQEATGATEQDPEAGDSEPIKQAIYCDTEDCRYYRESGCGKGSITVQEGSCCDYEN